MSVFEIIHSAAKFPIKKNIKANFEAIRKDYKLPGQERVKQGKLKLNSTVILHLYLKARLQTIIYQNYHFREIESE